MKNTFTKIFYTNLIIAALGVVLLTNSQNEISQDLPFHVMKPDMIEGLEACKYVGVDDVTGLIRYICPIVL